MNANHPAHNTRDANKTWLAQHLRLLHSHIDSHQEMMRWSKDELERAHIDAHKAEVGK